MQLKKKNPGLYCQSSSGEWYTSSLPVLSCVEKPIRKKAYGKFFAHALLEHEFDEGIGLNYAGARFYDPDIAMWISPDAAREFHSLYAYNPNPVNAVDPDGKRTLWVGGAGSQANTASYSLPIVNKMNAAGIKDARWMITPRNGMRELRALKTAYNSPASFFNSAKLISNFYDRSSGQFNLVGYSYGASEVAYAALKLANEGNYVDNVILLGSPLTEKDHVIQALRASKNVGNVQFIEIEGDMLTGQGLNPQKHFHYTTNEKGQQDQLIKKIQDLGVE